MNCEYRMDAKMWRLVRILTVAVALGAAQIVLKAQPLAQVQDTPDGPSYVQGQVLVEFDASASDATLRDAFRQAALRPLRGILTAAMKARGQSEISLLQTTISVPGALAILQRHPAVKTAQPNWIYQHCEFSNDPYYVDTRLWGMYGDATTPENPYGSQAAEAWANGDIGSRAVYVGVIDEGIMISHPDLAPNIWTNPHDVADGVDNDGNGYIDDIHGWDFVSNNNSVYDGSSDNHGTHVAGTIGAVGGNEIGVVGVNWEVTMIPAKFLGTYGGSTADAIEAIDYVVDLRTRHDLDVVALNNSWGGGGYDGRLRDAIVRAAQAGILFVAAAGNDHANNDQTPVYPACYDTTDGAGFDGVIAVAATDSSGNLASFSNYGLTTVDLGAPGVSINSTVPNNVGKPTYASYSGTSMATPHVTGAIALYAAAHPEATAQEIKDALFRTAIPTPALAGKTVTGGRLDAGELLKRRLSVTILSPADDASHLSTDGIQFSASATDDEGREAFTWKWTSSLAGTFGDQASFTASLPDGVHTITATATATDDQRITGEASVTITVGNHAPVVTIINPAGGATFLDTDVIEFSGTASDYEPPHDLSGGLAWISDLDGPIGTGASPSKTLSIGTHTITASVTDSNQATGSATIKVVVKDHRLVVAPSMYENEEAAGWSGTVSYVLRMQEVYAASHFDRPITIQGMAFRLDSTVATGSLGLSRRSNPDDAATNRSPVEITVPADVPHDVVPSVLNGTAEILVSLSSTTAQPDTFSTRFSSNTGTDETVVFSRKEVTFTANTGGTPNDFEIYIPFETPFPYDPALGKNLLVDITTFSAAANFDIDASNSRTDGASRVFSSKLGSPKATARDTGADVIQLIVGDDPPVAP